MNNILGLGRCQYAAKLADKNLRILTIFPLNSFQLLFCNLFKIQSNVYVIYLYGKNDKKTLIRSLRYIGGRLYIELGKTEIQIDPN